MFNYGSRRNQPCVVEPARPDDPRVMDDATGDAGRDGYTRLSRADRETGIRQPVGGVPSWPYPRIYED